MKKDVVPFWVRKIYRLIAYKNEWRRFFPEIGIRRRQNTLLREHYDAGTSKLIVFVIPGLDWATGKEKISGGLMSIVSLCEETTELRAIHGGDTILCTIQGDSLLLHHDLFENHSLVYRFDQLLKYFNKLEEVIIHLPEYLVSHFLDGMGPDNDRWLQKIEMLHVNILNQNIHLMPGVEIINNLKQWADKVTITTAHQKYCTPDLRKHYGVPVHKLSVWISPEQYHFVPWTEKENLLIVSPDPHPMKEAILQNLHQVKALSVQIIQGLTYQQYKELISRAKWTLTFGEGLDGYLIEPIFSGAVGFAVYNEEFFTEDFRQLLTLFSSIDELNLKIASTMEALDSSDSYIDYQRTQFELCSHYYNRKQYVRNIASFYKGEFTHA